MTHAEQAKQQGRLEELMIFEWFNVSQYQDGSVLNCYTMKTFTAQEIVDGELEPECQTHKLTIQIAVSLRRNALAAIKYGVNPRNLAPYYLTRKMVEREYPQMLWAMPKAHRPRIRKDGRDNG